MVAANYYLSVSEANFLGKAAARKVMGYAALARG